MYSIGLLLYRKVGQEYPESDLRMILGMYSCIRIFGLLVCVYGWVAGWDYP